MTENQGNGPTAYGDRSEGATVVRTGATRYPIERKESHESVLERWVRLEAMLNAARAVKALREAVHALEVIAAFSGEPGENARTGIRLVEKALAEDASLDA